MRMQLARLTKKQSRTPLFVLCATAAALVLACYLPYGVFTEWSYLRFLLPAFPLRSSSLVSWRCRRLRDCRSLSAASC